MNLFPIDNIISHTNINIFYLRCPSNRLRSFCLLTSTNNYRDIKNCIGSMQVDFKNTGEQFCYGNYQSGRNCLNSARTKHRAHYMQVRCKY